jgi:hypothetical protein
MLSSRWPSKRSKKYSGPPKMKVFRIMKAHIELATNNLTRIQMLNSDKAKIWSILTINTTKQITRISWINLLATRALQKTSKVQTSHYQCQDRKNRKKLNRPKKLPNQVLLSNMTLQLCQIH